MHRVRLRQAGPAAVFLVLAAALLARVAELRVPALEVVPVLAHVPAVERVPAAGNLAAGLVLVQELARAQVLVLGEVNRAVDPALASDLRKDN